MTHCRFCSTKPTGWGSRTCPKCFPAPGFRRENWMVRIRLSPRGRGRRQPVDWYHLAQYCRACPLLRLAVCGLSWIWQDPEQCRVCPPEPVLTCTTNHSRCTPHWGCTLVSTCRFYLHVSLPGLSSWSVTWVSLVLVHNPPLVPRLVHLCVAPQHSW